MYPKIILNLSAPHSQLQTVFAKSQLTMKNTLVSSKNAPIFKIHKQSCRTRITWNNYTLGILKFFMSIGIKKFLIHFTVHLSVKVLELGSSRALDTHTLIQAHRQRMTGEARGHPNIWRKQSKKYTLDSLTFGGWVCLPKSPSLKTHPTGLLYTLLNCWPHYL